jgi:hypothetical protein
MRGKGQEGSGKRLPTLPALAQSGSLYELLTLVHSMNFYLSSL